VKEVRPYAPYRGRLSLGNFERYPATAMYIDVERYSRTKSAKPLSASSFVLRSGTNRFASQQFSHTIQDGSEEANGTLSTLAAVKTLRTYRINDIGKGSARGKRDINHEDLARGYEYGRTAVPMTGSDANVTDFDPDSTPSFEIIGFIPSTKVSVDVHSGYIHELSETV
jgi:ATP-dependent DNA helicase 2 subunit 2